MPVSAVALLERPNGWDVALRFTESNEFATVVCSKGALLDAAVLYLGAWLPMELLQLERAIDLAGSTLQGRVEGPGPGCVVLRPGVSVVEAGGEFIETYSRALARFPVGTDRWSHIVAMAAQARDELALRFGGRRTLQLVVPSRDSGASVEEVGASLAALLRRVEAPTGVDEVLEYLCVEGGLDGSEARELLGDLMREGLVCGHTDPNSERR
jgi:hypothetical protein